MAGAGFVFGKNGKLFDTVILPSGCFELTDLEKIQVSFESYRNENSDFRFVYFDRRQFYEVPVSDVNASGLMSSLRSLTEKFASSSVDTGS